jgi:hypothetical protein
MLPHPRSYGRDLATVELSHGRGKVIMKKVSVLVIGVLSGWTLVQITSSFFGSPDERMVLPVAVRVAVFMVGGAASAWWVERNTNSVHHVVFNGFVLGTVEWVGQIVSTLVHRQRWIAAATDAATTKAEIASAPLNPSINSSLELMSSIFMLGICVTGLLVTWGARRRKAAAGPPSEPAAEQATSVPRPKAPNIHALLIAEIILISLIVLTIVTVRVSGVGIFAFLGIFVILPLFAALVWVSIAGAVKGIQLLKTRTHHNLALVTISVSAVPFLVGAIAMIASLRGSLEMQAHMKEREQEYSRIESFFQEPRRLEAVEVEGEKAMFVFAENVSIPVSIHDLPDVAAFCDKYWVGRELVIQLPDGVRYKWDSRGDASPEFPFARYLAELAWTDNKSGQSRVDTAARLVVGLHSVDPRRPDSDEVTRVAALLRTYADVDGSGFLDAVEGAELHHTIDFGVKAAKLVGYGFKDHSRIASETRVSVDDLEERARMYNELASRIQMAGCGELPYLELPSDDRSATAVHVPTPRR